MFANPWMLLGMGAGLAPIIIHLLARMRFKRVVWAAMQWLLESHKESRRRLRIEEWILLLIRIAILVLLAIGLARPLLQNTALYGGVIWLFFTIPLALAVWAATELRAGRRLRPLGRAAALLIGAGSLLWVYAEARLLFTIPLALAVWAATELRAGRRLRPLGRAAALLIVVGSLLWVYATAPSGDSEGPSGGWALHEPVHRIIVLDRSFSMRQSTEGRPAFDEAKEIAAFLLRKGSGIREGVDEVSVILAAERPEALYRDPSRDLARARADIGALESVDRATNIPAALAKAFELVGKKEKGHARKQIFVITDMTRDGWIRGGALRDETAVKLARQMDIDRRPLVALVNVGSETNPGNLAVADLRSETRIVTAGTPVRFTAQVVNHGRRDRTGVKLGVFVNGTKQAVRTIDVPADEPAGVAVWFSLTFAAPGPSVVSVELPGDVLRADNVRRLSLPVRVKIRVLCVDGDTRPEALESETDLLVRALAPGRNEAPEARFTIEPVVVEEMQLHDVRVSEFDLVILANVADVPPERWEVLQGYVRAGGALLLFLGERVDAMLYNEKLLETIERPGRNQPRLPPWFLPVRLGDPVGVARDAVDTGQTVSIQRGPYTHPALSLFQGSRQSGLATARIFRRFVCEADPEDESVEVVLRYSDSDGTPALIERRFGRGRVMLWTTTADKEWNNLPEKPAFLPLLHELVYHLVSAGQDARNVLVGEPLRNRLSPEDYAQDLEFHPPRRPDDPASPDPKLAHKDAESGGFTASLESAGRSGVYELRTKPGGDVRARFAVNVDPEESPLEPIGRDELEPMLVGINPHFVRGREALKELIVTREKGKELWLPFICTVLGLLLVECLLARLFGTHEDAR